MYYCKDRQRLVGVMANFLFYDAASRFRMFLLNLAMNCFLYTEVFEFLDGSRAGINTRPVCASSNDSIVWIEEMCRNGTMGGTPVNFTPEILTRIGCEHKGLSCIHTRLGGYRVYGLNPELWAIPTPSPLPFFYVFPVFFIQNRFPEMHLFPPLPAFQPLPRFQ